MIHVVARHHGRRRNRCSRASALGTQSSAKAIVTLKPKKGNLIIKAKSVHLKTKKCKAVLTLASKINNTNKIKLRPFHEINKHLDNARMLLLCSNATPIRCHGGIGYKCCFCPAQFPEAKDLKTHTLETHNDETKNTFAETEYMFSYIVKLDITDLKCKVCGESLSDLEDLIEHLVRKHEKRYHKDIKSHIIPFKFDTEALNCSICGKEFNNFKVLFQHMNEHFSNHVCEVCGNGFINARSLRTHSIRHQKGAFQCTFCPKVYDTRVKQKDHERGVHKYLNHRNKCAYCGVKFREHQKKKEHEVKIHGARPVTLKCQACDKIYDCQRLLTIHIKKYHMMERQVRK